MIIENKLIKISDEDYFAQTDYINSSTLKVLDSQTPLHLSNPRKDTDSLSFGSVAHKYLLENESFFDEYYVTPSTIDGSLINGLPIVTKKKKKTDPDFIIGSEFHGQKINRSLKVHKLFLDVLEKQMEGKKPVSQDDMAIIEQILQRLHDTGMYEQYLNSGIAEHAIFTTLKVNSSLFKVKVKLDYILQGEFTNTVIDLKTCSSSSKSDCLNQIKKYGYDIQAALYRDVVWQVLGKDVRWIWAFAEKNAPYQTTFFEMPDWMYIEAKTKYELALQKYEATIGSNIIRGYDECYSVGEFEERPVWWG